MKRSPGILYRLKSANLKWKLLAPFLLFSFVGTTALVYIGLTSQHDLIKREERKEISKSYTFFLTAISQKMEQALSIATVIAEDPEVQKLLAERQREKLSQLLKPLYRRLKTDFGIRQLHLHIPPGRSFLRIHLMDAYGEMMAYRKTPMEAMRLGNGVAGLEWGMSGLGIRGVAPIIYDGRIAGSVEIGFPFDRLFLENLQEELGPDFTVYEKTAEGVYRFLATTVESPRGSPHALHLMDSMDVPIILIAPDDSPEKSILLGPVKDYYEEVVAVVAVDVDRTAIKERLVATRTLMIVVGIIGIIVSFGLTWLVAVLFVRPIKEIVGEAEEIAYGKRESRLADRPDDEIGMLTRSLNSMLESLKEKRIQLEEYARNLEIRVQDRTADLVALEEKYRTLVENLPLIVYRLLKDGTTEFINSYFTEKLGYSTEEVVGDKHFWREKICKRKDAPSDDLWEVCWGGGEEYKVERLVKDKHGQPHTFFDHAIPFRGEKGDVKWIDGIMMDTTELKKLQERALRTEEIRILGEISARFAHEIRNPLATAGGFARRLRDSLPQGDAHRRFAEIIVSEVARLEDILQIILSTIEPFTLCLSEVDMVEVLTSWMKDLEPQIKEKRIEPVFPQTVSVPLIQGDEGLLNRAFGSLLRHAIISIPEGEKLFISLELMNEFVEVKIRHRASSMAEEDLDQFFLPRFTGKRAGAGVLDLPLSKVIVHRHGGRIDVSGEDGNWISVKVELPLRASGAVGLGQELWQ
jgi:PAS domain S-box-containing protein